MASSNRTFVYKKPSPFVVPQVFTIEGLPSINIPRETLHYSSVIIEEIMKNINDEYDFRGRTKPVWKAYKAGTDNFTTFSPDPVNGNNLSRVPLKFFPTIVRDIQIAIESLVKDDGYPDDLPSYFARIFGNATIHRAKNIWNSSTIIKDGYVVPATNSEGKQTLNPFTNILEGTWPFPVNTADYFSDNHVSNPLARIGVDMHGDKYIQTGKDFIETSAQDFPEPQIGKQRTEEGLTIVNGQTISNPRSTLTGIDGFELPMRPEGRPTSNRENQQNTSTGFGMGQVDLDAGYGYMGHHPLVVEQLRWQPPIIEKFFGPDSIKDAHYTSRVISNTTINLPFVYSNPVEKTWFLNWGNWLVKGKASSSSTGLSLAASPDQFNGFIFTDCPFPVFYPPSTVTCSCRAGDTSYAVWGAGGLEDVLEFNKTFIFQTGSPHTLPKRIGPKTRIRVKHTYTVSQGSPNPRHYYAVMARFNAISSINLQPFIPIYVAEGSSPDSALLDFFKVKDMDVQSHSDGAKSVNIIDAIKKSYTQYNQTTDFILAIGIFVRQEVGSSKICPVIDVSGGSIVSPSCASSLVCTMGEIKTETSYLMLWEPPLEENDIRLST